MELTLFIYVLFSSTRKLLNPDGCRLESNEKIRTIDMNIYPMIMAGGSGTRFWPRSRQDLPKQALNIVHDNETMIQSAVNLLDGLIPKENIHIVTNQNQADLLQSQTKLNENQIIKEPCARDTAPCVGLAAAIAFSKDPEAVLLMMPSDHIITPKEDFHSAVKTAAMIACNEDAVVTFGILPHFPATGYGYIEQGELISRKFKEPVYQVKKFTEKPNLETAIKFLETKKFFWNAGIFVWKARTILKLIKELMPELHAGLNKIVESNFTNIDTIYPTLPKISIDFGIMEKAKNVKVVQVNYAWDDVGSWESLVNHFPKDNHGNLNQGQVVHINSKDSIVISDNKDALIATIGVENLLIVQNENATLIANRENGQDIKALVEKLKESKLDRYL